MQSFVSWKRNVNNRQKHRGFKGKIQIKIKMAGPVFNVSTNKRGSKLSEGVKKKKKKIKVWGV